MTKKQHYMKPEERQQLEAMHKNSRAPQLYHKYGSGLYFVGFQSEP